MATGDPIANLNDLIGLLNKMLRGEADEDVNIDGTIKPTLSKVAAEYAANHGVYPTINEGLSAVGDGGVFAVPGENDEAFLTLYRNLDGQADRIADAPSSARVSEITDLLRRTETNRVCAQVTDELGFALWVAMTNGGFGSDNAFLSPKGLFIEGDGSSVTVGDGEYALAEWSDEGLRTNIAPSLVSRGKSGAILAIYDGSGFLGMELSDDGFNALNLPDGGSEGAAASVAAPLPVTPSTQVVAHRGLHTFGIAPENSLDAYRYAGLAGYRYVETDVRYTSDGQFVIMHDDTINRTMVNLDNTAISGDVEVVSTDYDTLRNNYIMASPIPAQRTPIPSLTEFLDVCMEYDLHPVIEVTGFFWTEADMKNLVDTCIREMGVKNFSFCGKSGEQLDYIRTQNADVELWYISEETPEKLASVKPSVSYLNRRDVSADHVHECRALGVGVGGWTAPADEFEKFAGRRLDFIATDYIAPSRPRGSAAFAFSDISDVEGGEFAGGVLTLTEGTSAEIPIDLNVVDLLGVYIRLRVKGAFTVESNQLTASYSYGDYRYYQSQTLARLESPYLTITGGAGGASITSIELTAVKLGE